MQAPATLLVDDNQGFADTMASLAAESDLSLDTAATWEEGVSAFRVGRHQLVVCDYGLEGSRLGFELLAEVKRIVPSTRVILYSGYLDSDAEAILRPAGIVDLFLVRGPQLAAMLVEEMRLADARAASEPDWRATAAALRSRDAMDKGVLDDVDRALRRAARPGLGETP